ncbi:hypothetical protein [Microvirga sp. G4-2]|uniref:hypothetical protein n=1 Tax=Microvirga sp. G4-2 TaxID=3434467 RepID=UPI004043D52E
MAVNEQKVTVAKALSNEEVIAKVLEAMQQNTQSPKALADWIIHVGVTNPFQLQEVRKGLKAHLMEGGSHFHLTKSGRWLRTTEKWADGLGVDKGKAEAKYRASVPAVETVRDTVQSAMVPATVKDAAETALNVFNARANKKLDRASIEIASEQIHSLVSKTEELQKDKDQADKYAEDARQTRDKLLTILDRLSIKLGGDDDSSGGYKVAAE